MIVDTHAHLDFPELSQDLDAVLHRARANDVRQIITIGISLPSSESAVALAGAHADIFATVGIHPHGAQRMRDDVQAAFHDLGKKDKVVAIGEIGLDYYRDRQPRAVQKECLRQQLEIACELNLPAVFHVREAFDDFLELVQEYGDRLAGGVMHCFSGTWQIACKCLDLGFYLSIPGTVTFAKAQVQQDVARQIPLERLLVETDAPFLAPVPYRGKVNEPSFVLHTVEKIAELRGLTVEEVGAQTSLNAQTVFALDPS